MRSFKQWFEDEMVASFGSLSGPEDNGLIKQQQNNAPVPWSDTAARLFLTKNKLKRKVMALRRRDDVGVL